MPVEISVGNSVATLMILSGEMFLEVVVPTSVYCLDHTREEHLLVATTFSFVLFVYCDQYIPSSEDTYFTFVSAGTFESTIR